VIRTLVVDDDFRVAELHAAYLERVGGFQLVGSAQTAAEALAIVHDAHPELMLLDIYLPDRSGLEVIRELRGGAEPMIDIIAITAARDVATIRTAIQSGAIHYLIKPFTFNAFREKLQSYAEARSRLDALGDATQAEVDTVFGALRTTAEDELPKGISAATRDLIVESLHKVGEPASAAEVARLTGLSRVTARRYLEHLCRSGRADLHLEYGSPGRPEHRYRLTGG